VDSVVLGPKRTELVTETTSLSLLLCCNSKGVWSNDKELVVSGLGLGETDDVTSVVSL